MPTYNLICDSPDHASRSSEPDYVDPLGTIEASSQPSSSGMKCPACARLDAIPTLAQAKAVKCLAIDRRTDEIIMQGFEYPSESGHVFSASDDMQRTLMGTYISKDHPAMAYPIEWDSSNGTGSIELEDASDVETFYFTGLGFVRACKDSGTALKDLVHAATTLEEVNAVVDDR